MHWIHNNLHPYTSGEAKQVNCCITYINVLCATRKDDVEEELHNLLHEMFGIKDLDPRMPEYFQQCNTAAKWLYKGMDANEKYEVDKMVDEWRLKPNEPEKQRK